MKILLPLCTSILRSTDESTNDNQPGLTDALAVDGDGKCAGSDAHAGRASSSSMHSSSSPSHSQSDTDSESDSASESHSGSDTSEERDADEATLCEGHPKAGSHLVDNGEEVRAMELMRRMMQVRENGGVAMYREAAGEVARQWEGASIP